MSEPRIFFRVHALQRMFQYGVAEVEVRDVLENGETIEDYPGELPFPARLMLGWVDRRPLHVVAAFDGSDACIIVITVYRPDPARWDRAFRKRSNS